MPQAKGTKAKVTLTEELVVKEIPEYVLEACEAVWDQHEDANVNLALDSTLYKNGSNALRMSLEASLLAPGDLLAAASLDSLDLTDYSYLGLWMRADASLQASALFILLDNSTSCASPLESLPIAAMPANTWTFQKLPLANPAALTTAVSLGVKIGIDVDATIWIDDVRAINPAVYQGLISEDVKLSQELISSEEIQDTRNEAEPELGAVSVDGPLSCEFSPYRQRLYRAMVGGIAVTGAGAPYLYKAYVADLPSFQYEKGFTDIGKYHVMGGAKVATWKISLGPKGLAKLDLTWMAARETVRSRSYDPSPVVYAHKPYSGFRARLKESALGTQLGVVTLAEIEGNNNLDGEQYVIDGTGERYDIPEGRIAVSGMLTCLFTNEDLYDKAKAGTTTKLVVELWHGTGAGTTAGNEKTTLTMDELKFKPQAPGIPGPQGIRIELPFIAFYSAGTNASSFVIETLLPNNTTLY